MTSPNNTIADLIHYRSENECLVERKAERNIETPYGTMRLIAYTDRMAQETHLALVKGNPSQDQEVLVRVHEPLSVFDLLDSSSSSHSWNTLKAIKEIQSATCGVIVLLNRNENGEDLLSRIAHADEPIRQKQDLRNYGIGSQILLDLGVRKCQAWLDLGLKSQVT